MFWSQLDPYIIGAILALSACSVITRCSYMVFGNRFPLSEGAKRALRYAPVSALIAIIIPELLPLTSQPAELVDIRVIAAICAVIIFLVARSTMAVILGGMVVLWSLQILRAVLL